MKSPSITDYSFSMIKRRLRLKPNANCFGLKLPLFYNEFLELIAQASATFDSPCISDNIL